VFEGDHFFGVPTRRRSSVWTSGRRAEFSCVYNAMDLTSAYWFEVRVYWLLTAFLMAFIFARRLPVLAL